MNQNNTPNIDAAPSLKASVFEEVKPESRLSSILTMLEEESRALESELLTLQNCVGFICRPYEASSPFVGDESDNPMKRIEDLLKFTAHQRHRVNHIIGHLDL